MEVSIIVCTRNRAARLHGTLSSIASVKSDHRWEAIILDNGSTDHTRSVIEAAQACTNRIRYLYEPQLGLGAARDTAWRMARGKICSFTDDDCYITPEFVDAVVAAYQNHPDAGCIGGRIMLFDPLDAPLTIDEGKDERYLPPYRYFSGGSLQGANMSFRREVLEEIRGFDREFGAGTPFPAEDVDVIASSIWAGYPAYFDPRIVVYHHHGRRGVAAAMAVEGYDRGRGVYHAKFLLRSDTRIDTLRHWVMQGRHNKHLTQGALTREFEACSLYLRHRGKSWVATILKPYFLLIRLVKLYHDLRSPHRF